MPVIQPVNTIYPIISRADENRILKCATLQKQSVAGGATQDLINVSTGGNVAAIFIAMTKQNGYTADTIWKAPFKIWRDNEDDASTDTIAGSFFASQYGAPKWSSLFMGSSVYWDTGAVGYYRYIDVPFTTKLQITLTNPDADNSIYLWSQVYYYDGIVKGNPREKIFRTISWKDATVVQYAARNLIDQSGKKGKLLGLSLGIDGNSNYAYLEGDVEIWVDGTKYIHASGTEDFFMGSFHNNKGKWQSPFTGMTKQHTRTDNTDVYKTCWYRLFILDQVVFNSSLKIVWYNGESGGGTPGDVKIYSDVWYYTTN